MNKINKHIHITKKFTWQIYFDKTCRFDHWVRPPFFSCSNDVIYFGFILFCLINSAHKWHLLNSRNLRRFLLSFSEQECYDCLASLVAAKDKVFITQTKLLHEVTWKTVMQIANKHAVRIYFIFIVSIYIIYTQNLHNIVFKFNKEIKINR